MNERSKKRVTKNTLNDRKIRKNTSTQLAAFWLLRGRGQWVSAVVLHVAWKGHFTTSPKLARVALALAMKP
ncbi:Protein of unknown function [Pyronema omphalodes CBS 100304]|uniref:Uncharacterized protein n=1 Tax=Pyronema omphalodes (strain CBS 100304) TaxID=1076935 RepID=U4LGM3_PYROM|nr:Protein of unknown function [Pyronema omphalodes CBS 100304]